VRDQFLVRTMPGGVSPADSRSGSKGQAALKGMAASGHRHRALCDRVRGFHRPRNDWVAKESGACGLSARTVPVSCWQNWRWEYHIFSLARG